MEGSPIVTNNTNISPDFFPGRFFLLPPKHAQFGHAGGKSQIASKCLWGRISLVKIKKARGKSRSLHSREWLVCVRWRWRSVLSTLALWLCLTWTEVGVNAPSCLQHTDIHENENVFRWPYTVSNLFNLTIWTILVKAYWWFFTSKSALTVLISYSMFWHWAYPVFLFTAHPEYVKPESSPWLMITPLKLWFLHFCW